MGRVIVDAGNAEYEMELEIGVELMDEDGTRTRDQDRNKTRTEAGYLAKGWCSTSLGTEVNLAKRMGNRSLKVKRNGT